jgi:hypothetical protein
MSHSQLPPNSAAGTLNFDHSGSPTSTFLLKTNGGFGILVRLELSNDIWVYGYSTYVVLKKLLLLLKALYNRKQKFAGHMTGKIKPTSSM